MPPKAVPKEKALKGDEADDLVLQYLKSVNRPYASTDVSANLKNKVTKTQTQKILTDLAAKGSLTVKNYSKQTIFVYNQSLLNVASADELAGLDQSLKQVQSDLEEKRKELRNAQAALTAQANAPKTTDLAGEIARIKKENALANQTLSALRGEDDGQEKMAPMTDEEMKKIDDEFAFWRKHWVDRRKIYKELFGQLGEGGSIADPKSFQDDQGINLDDEEALEVEQGEFCKPAPMRRPATKQAAPVRKTIKPSSISPIASQTPASQSSSPTATTKRSSSATLVEEPKKKRGKKAKAEAKDE